MIYRRDIEGLRALAVVAVLLYHFGVPGLDGGFIGVDVFFVISGFLITSLLISERERSGRISIAGFYARRARRLLPISATVLVATAVAGALLLPATRLPDLAADVRWAAGFAANLLFAHRGGSYLTADLAPSPLRHYWSLSVEEQFYVVWPGLIALVTLGARRVQRRIAVAMAVIVATSFALSIVLTSGASSWAYYGLHTRAWELGVGALLAALAGHTARVPQRLRAALGWLGLAGIAYSAVTFGHVSFPGWAAALPVLAAAALLVAGPHTPGSPARALSWAPFTYLGTRSYSLYLWHWPVIVLAEAHLERGLTVGEKVAAVALVVALAEAGYRLIEQPIRSSTPLIRRPRLSLTMGATLVAVALLAGVALNAYDPDLRTGVVAAAPDALSEPTTTTTVAATIATPTTVAETTTTVPLPPLPITMTDTEALAAVVAALSTTAVPDNVRPTLRAARNDTGIVYGNGCHLYNAATVRTDCVFGDPNGTITIALWGDSHAAQWFTALDAIAATHGWRLLSLTQGGCPVLDVAVYNRSADAVFRHCAKWRESVRAYLVEQQVDVVFLSQHYGLFDAESRKPIAVDQWQVHLPELLTGLRADGIEPVVIGDSPDPPQNVPNCVAAHRTEIQTCVARSDDADEVALESAIRTVTTDARVGFIEPDRWLCSGGVCPVVVGDILVYRDDHHLSNTVVAWLTPVLEAFIVPFVEDEVAYGLLTGS